MIDKTKFLDSYEEGLTDSQIAKLYSCSTETVRLWRIKNNLPTTFSYDSFKKYDYDKVQKLVSQNLTDLEVGELLGIPPITVYFIRKNNGFERLALNVNQPIEPTQRQLEIIIGTICGDASLILPKGGLNTFYKCEHGIEQKDYVFWKYQELLSLDVVFQTYTRNKVDERTGIKYESAVVYSKSNPALNYLQKEFYKDGHKELTEEMMKDYSELSMATHYMDDGSKVNNSFIFYTTNFNDISIDIFRNHLKDKWNIDTTKRASNDVYVSAKSKKDFQGIIEPYIISSMRYKLYK